MAFNCYIACSRLFLAVSSIIVATLTLCLFTVDAERASWSLEVASLSNSSAASTSSLAFFSSFKISASFPGLQQLLLLFLQFFFFLFLFIVSASNSFFFSSFSWSNLALYAECAKRTDFLISLVTGIFSGLQFTGSWNFTASFRSHKPTMVCSPSLDLSFVTTLALTERLR